jgi:hypothetical protein
MTFPEILNEDVRLAYEALGKALSASADANGVQLVGVAVTWAAQHEGSTGFNCIYNEGMTADLAHHMAGVLIADTEELEFDIELPKAVIQ